MTGHPIDVAGRRYGRWTVLALHPERKRYGRTSVALWRCRCDCGSERVVFSRALRGGVSTSCGCFQREQLIKRNRKHGHAFRGRKTRAYTRWRAMMRRCFDANAKGYPDYGGRGITVCARWRKFENFYADMGEPPAGLSIDRIDNDKGYSPKNCRWATASEQVRNRRPPKRKRRSSLPELQAYAAALARAA